MIFADMLYVLYGYNKDIFVHVIHVQWRSRWIEKSETTTATTTVLIKITIRVWYSAQICRNLGCNTRQTNL